MQYTTVAFFTLMATAAFAEPIPKGRGGGGKPSPKPNPSPNPAPGPAPAPGRKINKGNAAACVASVGGATGGCGVDIAQQVNDAAANGGEIAGCVFDLISAYPDCRDLTG